MTSGGSRNRNRLPDEKSGRSARRGYTLTTLPAEGYKGPTPEFPLPDSTPRELEVWAEAWRSPQACAWALPTEAWRARTVAMWVRLGVRCEQPDAGAALLSQLHRFADQIGMTTAGLAEMGWKVAVDEVEAKREERAPAEKPAQASARARVKVVSGGGGA